MASSNSAKGNPASTRMSNSRRKARRAECWARSEKRKKALRETQEAAHKRNLATIAAGGKTPWQLAKARRRAA